MPIRPNFHPSRPDQCHLFANLFFHHLDGRDRGEPHSSGLGTVRCIVEHANAWLLANKRLDRRNDRLTNIIDALLTAACIFVIANRLTDL